MSIRSSHLIWSHPTTITGAKRSRLRSHGGTWLAALALILPWVAGASSVRGQESEPAPPSLQPADVFVRVGVVRAELELIRLEMGRQRHGGELYEISNVAPLGTYVQALALLRKSSRLCYEHTHTHTEEIEPEPATSQVRPEHVYRVVDAALDRLGRVKEKLGITEEVESSALDASKTTLDVFRSIVLANRQLNFLLDRQYAPSDVYEQITLAIGYTSRLLASFPGATRIPPTPEFVRRKRPADVYERLFGCVQLVGSVARHSGLEIVRLTRIERDQAQITPGDVYGLATLMVSELAHIHARLADAEPPVPPYYPGRKLPSHVYQRVGILEAQLIELDARVRARPSWLDGGGPRR